MDLGRLNQTVTAGRWGKVLLTGMTDSVLLVGVRHEISLAVILRIVQDNQKNVLD